MKAIFYRFAGCVATLLLCCVLFPQQCNFMGILWESVLLTALYTFIRPLLQAVIAPFNFFLLGVLTPLTDALLVLWMASWSPFISLKYWQCIIAALLLALMYIPYSSQKKRALLN